MKNVLIISPHADDAEIGCGGVVLNNVLPGDVVVGNPARVLRGKNV